MEQLYETGWRKWIIVFTVITCTIIELIDTSIVNVALAQMMGNLGATLTEASWVITAYSIANVIIVPMAAWLARQFGRTNYYTGSVILFTLASVGCGFSTDIWTLVFFRFLQGIGGGALFATSQAILQETFPKEQQGLATGLFGMGVVVGPTIGPTLGGYIVDNFNWQWCFFVNIPIGITATILSLLFIKDKIKYARTAASDVDWLGIGLLVLGIGSLQYILEEGQSDNWFESPLITSLAFTSALSLVGFCWRELTTEKPIVDLRLLRYPTLAAGTILSFVLGFGLYSSVFLIPVFVQQILGYTAMQTGLMLLPASAAMVIFMPMAGRALQSKVPFKYFIVVGYSLFCTFSFFLSFLISPVTGADDFFWALMLRGLGMAFSMLPVLQMSFAEVGVRDIAQAAGITGMMRQLGGSFGVAILSTYVYRSNVANRIHLLAQTDPSNAAFQQRLMAYTNSFFSKSGDIVASQSLAYKGVEGMLFKQAAILTYTQSFQLVGMIFLCCIPFILLIPNRRPQAAIDTSGAH